MHVGLEDEVDLILGTFSKSLGGQGGFVCGTKELIEYVVAFSRSRFFSCNLSPVLVAGLRAGLQIAADEPDLRQKLWSNVPFLRRRFERPASVPSAASPFAPSSPCWAAASRFTGGCCTWTRPER